MSVWCLASATEERGAVPFTVRAIQRRVLPDRGVDDVDAMLTHLVALGLLAQRDKGGYSVTNWDKRQYTHSSWTPEARREQKRKEREARRQEQAGESAASGGRNDVATMSQQQRNGFASGRKIDIDTDTDTDTESETPFGRVKPMERERVCGGRGRCRSCSLS